MQILPGVEHGTPEVPALTTDQIMVSVAHRTERVKARIKALGGAIANGRFDEIIARVQSAFTDLDAIEVAVDGLHNQVQLVSQEMSRVAAREAPQPAPPAVSDNGAAPPRRMTERARTEVLQRLTAMGEKSEAALRQEYEALKSEFGEKSNGTLRGCLAVVRKRLRERGESGDGVPEASAVAQQGLGRRRGKRNSLVAPASRPELSLVEKFLLRFALLKAEAEGADAYAAAIADCAARMKVTECWIKQLMYRAHGKHAQTFIVQHLASIGLKRTRETYARDFTALYAKIGVKLPDTATLLNRASTLRSKQA